MKSIEQARKQLNSMKPMWYIPFMGKKQIPLYSKSQVEFLILSIYYEDLKKLKKQKEKIEELIEKIKEIQKKVDKK